MSKFDIEITVKFKANFNDIDAKNSEEAKIKAKEILDDFYHLNTVGAHHLPINVDLEYDVWEYEDI